MSKFTLLLFGFVMFLVAPFVAGCGSQPTADQEPSATPVVIVVTATDEPPTPTPEVIVVVVTATDEPGTETQAEEPTSTPMPEDTAEPTEEATATELPPPTATDIPPSPTAVVPACSTNGALRLRAGPGESYIIIRNLAPGTEMSPQAYVANGFPAGAWLLVDAGGQQGWVSASPQFVSCNFVASSLPAPASIPPTSTPIPSPTAVPPTPTPVVVAQLPINVGRPSGADDADPGQVPPGRTNWRLEESDDFLFRFYVNDLTAGNHDGDGIDWVLIVVQDQNGNIVDSRKERTAGYCIFGGGEPTCNPWKFEDGVYKWTSTGLPVVDGTYQLTVYVKPKSDDLGGDFFTMEDGTDVWAWFLNDFPVNVP
ncbi:MAG: hypothetical protein ACK2UR_09425 [Candidatus Promineifilaceae bacterium]